MFKLSVISDEVSQDLEKVAKFAVKYGLDGIEIRTVWNKPPQELLSNLSDIKKIVNKYGLSICCIASPFFKADIDSEEEYHKHIMILKNCISLAKSLDTNIIRGFTFWRVGKIEDYIDRILEKFREPLDIIESEGIILAIENEPSTFVTNGRYLDYFIKKIGSKNVKAVWDPGNDLSDPYGEEPYPTGYNFAKKYMVHMHVKDGVRRGRLGKHEARPVGEGEVNYKEQFKALIRDNYNGYVSLETHWRPKKQLTEEQVVRPGGAEFSEMGEIASEICIKNILKILEEIR